MADLNAAFAWFKMRLVTYTIIISGTFPPKLILIECLLS